MKVRQTAAATVLLLTMIGGSVFAQDPAPDPAPQAERHTRMKNPIAAASGLLLAIFGAAFAVSGGRVGDDWSINGSNYCDHSGLSQNRIDIRAGSCERMDATAPRVGYTMLATGGVLMLYGFQRVQVVPTVGRNVIGATATVQW